MLGSWLSLRRATKPKAAAPRHQRLLPKSLLFQLPIIRMQNRRTPILDLVSLFLLRATRLPALGFATREIRLAFLGRPWRQLMLPEVRAVLVFMRWWYFGCCLPPNEFLSFFTVAAQYLEKYPHFTPHEVATALRVHAIRGAVTGLDESTMTPNFLLNTGDLQGSS